MKTAVVNIKTEKRVKNEAQKVARELGLPLGTILNAYLRELIREKRILFSAPPVPNRRLQKLLKEVARDTKKGKKSAGPFAYEKAVAYLDRL